MDTDFNFGPYQITAETVELFLILDSILYSSAIWKLDGIQSLISVSHININGLHSYIIHIQRGAPGYSSFFLSAKESA